MKRLTLFFGIGFFAILLSSCAKYPEKLSIKDTLDLKESLSDILKSDYGLFINKDVKISSTEDFNNFKLVLMGETEPNMDIRLVTLGMNKTNKFLFSRVTQIQISNNMSNPDKDKPGATMNENLTINGNGIPSVKEIYGKDADLSTISEKMVNSTDCVFLMKKANSIKISDKLKELILK